MPILQVHDLPDEIYSQIHLLAQKEHRTITQQTILMLQDSIYKRIGNKNKRRLIFKKIEDLNIEANQLPNPVTLLREDREYL
ncbi:MULTISPECIES: hypothetical protein [unclassified Treponema]|uniref:hypothetical protein n=1 Tax=unclassified Treponema TaxID=2638727 RepID=UPI0020A58F2B|nr:MULTISPECIES: hypothetical protein [unclassified Treponema]UTC66653.1 hypothetical protein E4O06_11940 [Treponema sp. OMZ 789]UTC69385.1 hypothetical protein E4O01_12080 [Treponema sp. OMZ 790]UTC72100.1 hypothetical protein E4O02_12175 [Treponema sp. OMZ 791]